jgi:hypothetical protein
MSADFFSDKPFGNEEPTLDTTQMEPQAPDNQDNLESDDSSQRERYQYWQSKHDKLKADYERVLQQQQQAQPVQQQQQNVVSQPVPDKPSRPSKPQNYSPEEAYTDPTSDSFKYRVAVDDYNEKYQEYLDYYNEQMQQRERAYQQQAREQELINQTKQEVMYEYGLDAKQAEDFLVTMSSPDTMSLENLVSYYRFLKGNSQPPQTQQQQQSASVNPIQRPAAPPPPAGVISAAGNGMQQPSEEDAFIQSMINYRR